MKKLIYAFIDSYEEITVIGKNNYKGKNFYLYDNEGNLLEELDVSFCEVNKNFTKYVLKYHKRLHLTRDYYILDDLNNKILLEVGSIVRAAEFESRYYYDGPLGVEYSKEKCIFRIWTPVAKSIILMIRNSEVNTEKKLEYVGKGLWSLELEGDWECAEYYYLVRVFDEYIKVTDPYGISSTANGEANYVIDMNKLYKMKHEKPYFSGYYSDALVYEASVRDMTVSLDSDKKGTFLGMVDNQANKYQELCGLDYIASLGVTHLQLLPIFDFGGVDDYNKDEMYNWGYNPEQYFIPNGWYSINPNDPYSRINELLELIDEAHHRGLRIVMDVVFNHVYKKDYFPLGILVPGYFYRVDYFGNETNVSGCGNDLATEKRMCSRFIVDNLKFWAKYYNISGFRFDLMGLLDIDTMNIAYDELRKYDENIMVYGEGWNMPNSLPDAYRPHAYNHYKMPHYAFFNDKYRDSLKGNQWDGTPGFVFGNDARHKDIYSLIAGSCLRYFRFDNPNQTINYVECHDNYTFYDFSKEKLKMSDEQVLDGSRLALQVILTSQGVPFIHAGEEFYRTKKGVENSYNASDDVNLFDYSRRDKYLDDINGLKDLIAIRKKYPEFRMTNSHDIAKKMHYVEGISKPHLLCYILEGVDYLLTVCINTKKEASELIINNSTMIFNGYKSCNIKESTYNIKDVGVYIFKEDK